MGHRRKTAGAGRPGEERRDGNPAAEPAPPPDRPNQPSSPRRAHNLAAPPPAADRPPARRVRPAQRRGVPAAHRGDDQGRADPDRLRGRHRAGDGQGRGAPAAGRHRRRHRPGAGRGSDPAAPVRDAAEPGGGQAQRQPVRPPGRCPSRWSGAPRRWPGCTARWPTSAGPAPLEAAAGGVAGRDRAGVPGVGSGRAGPLPLRAEPAQRAHQPAPGSRMGCHDTGRPGGAGGRDHRRAAR